MRPIRGTIGVGVIGANPDRGWAGRAHIPALKAVPQYTLTALSTSRAETARQAAEKFGVTRAYDDHLKLVNDPSVDLVTVTVRVPMHRELVTAALEAGKMVYCEWPLGDGVQQAEELAALAKRKGLLAVVGLQGRFSPAVQQVIRLLEEGYVGRVLSCTVIGSGMAWGPVSSAADAYINDLANGATLLSIPLTHTLDAVCCALGDIEYLTASVGNYWTEVTVKETGKKIPKTAEDQVVIAGRLTSGAAFAVHYRGGCCHGTNFLWEINGSEGDLSLSGPGGHLQFMEPVLRGGRHGERGLSELPIAPTCRWAPRSTPNGPPYNVAQAYVRLAQDLRFGTQQVATFEHAVARHRMVAAVYEAARTGMRQILNGAQA